MIAPAVLLPSLVLLLGIAPTRQSPPVDFPDRVERGAEQTERSGGAIRFRRVLAPADRMKDWPTGGERYLPMDAAEFERLVGILKPRDAQHPVAPAAAIASARYEARLDGERLIGKAVLEVVLARDGPAALTLEPCAASIGDARWRFAGGASTAAAWGLTGDGKLAALVERPGRLEFDWTLAARRDSGDVPYFTFEMPSAAANRLSVELPDDCAPSVDRGLVLGGEPSGEGTRRWRIEPARLGRFNLHVIPAEAEAKRPLALLRESRTYDCSPRGLELTAQWKLQAHDEPLDRVAVLLDPGLRLVSARLGESSIPWSAAPPAGDGAPTKIELRLPEPIRDAERVIRLAAVGPLTLDRNWRLPRIRCDGLLWQEGGATLLIPEPLAAERIEPIGCVQTGVGPLSAPRAGRSGQFQCFDADATVEVLLAVRPSGGEASKPTDAEASGNPPLEQDARAESAARYSGVVKATAEVGNGTVQETCLLRCVPEGGRVGRVLVRLAPGRPTPPAWTLDGRGDNFSARRWSDEEQAAAGADPSIETWELTLSRPRKTPFEIAAARETILKPRAALTPGPSPETGEGSAVPTPESAAGDRGSTGAALTLASLPEAADQQGTIVIRGLGAGAFNVENRLLQPVLPEPVPPERVQNCRGAFRYDPSEDVGRWRAAAPRIASADDAAAPPAWVWKLRLESWYQRGATARHLATYELQSAGRRRLELVLPPGIDSADIHGVWVDGRPAAWQMLDRDRRRSASIELPADEKFPRAAVEWTTVEPRLGVAGTLSAAPPEPDLPVLARSWIVRLPPGYEGVDRPAGESSDAPQGWTAWRTDASGSSPPAMRYARRDSMRLFGVIAFLLLAAAGCWKRNHAECKPWAWRTSGMYLPLALLGLFAVGAALSPNAYMPLAWGGALGAVFCLVWRWIGRPARAVDPPPQRLRDHSDSTVWTASPLGLIILAAATAILGCGPMLFAEGSETGEDEANRPATAASVCRVFVPIDAQRKPVGGKVYVPERFYRELHRRAESVDKPPAWMICGAVYRCELAREESAGRLTAGSVRAQYDLRVLEPGATVRLPLRAEGAAILAGSPLLDGRPVEPRPDSDPAALAIEIAEPGQYRLELVLRPTMCNDGVSGGFDLSIPRVPTARLEMTLPDDAPAIEVPSARGGVQAGKGPGRLAADLGPADRLSVRWEKDAAADGAGRAVEVEQLAWLKVQPGSVQIAVKFKFHSVEGRIRQVRLAVDPRLRLLPLSGDDPPTVRVAAESGNARQLTFRWPRPIADKETLEAVFLLGGASGVGKIPLPKIEPLDFKPVKNWAAFSVDPTLDHDQQFDEPIESAAVADFLQAWGKSDQSPRAAFRLTEGRGGWTISTRPRQPRGKVDQCLTLGFDEDRVGVLFEASISAASGYIFQHRLTAPKELTVESVSVLEEDIERVQRWSRDDDGTIAVFLAGPASGTQKLVLRGRLPIVAGRQWPLPPLRIRQAELGSATIRLFRRPGVLLEVVGREGEQLILDDVRHAAENFAETARKLDLGRPARTIRWDGAGRPPAAVIVTANRPRVKAEQSVRLQDNGRRWSAAAEFHLAVGEGLVDEIRVRAPAPWNGPFAVDRPGELQLRDVPGEGRCIVFRPREAIAADFTFTVSGPLDLAPGERPRAADIRLLGADELKRRIVLPNRNENRTYRWRTDGLEPVEDNSSPAACCYQISGERYRAILDSVAVAGAAGSVRLADVALAWQSDGRLRGAAVLEIEPGGSADRALLLPEGCELIQASVAGMSAAPRRLGENRWRLSLASADEPQQVEVVYRGRLPETDRTGRVRFEAPRLADAPVRRTRWSIGVPAGRSVSDPQGAEVVDPWKPADILRCAIGNAQQSVNQYESADGGTTLSLVCRPARADRLPRYLACAVALAAFGLLGLGVSSGHEKR